MGLTCVPPLAAKEDDPIPMERQRQQEKTLRSLEPMLAVRAAAMQWRGNVRDRKLARRANHAAEACAPPPESAKPTSTRRGSAMRTVASSGLGLRQRQARPAPPPRLARKSCTAFCRTRYARGLAARFGLVI